MGIAFEDRTVHECARVTLVRVADHVFLFGLHLAGDFPFEARGETAAATAPEPRVDDLADHLVGLHFQRFAQRSIAVAGDVLVDVLRVDEAAVAQRNADLGLVELHVLAVRYMFPGVGSHEKQPLDLAALEDVFAHDLFGVLGFD